MKLLKTTGWQGVLGLILNLPIILLIGLFYILPCLIFKQYKFLRRSGVILEFTVIPGSWMQKKFWNTWAGMSFYNFITYNNESYKNEMAVKHERRHSEQALTFNILFVPIYCFHVLWIYFFQKDKHSYYDCVFERDARKHAGQPVNIPRERWLWGPDDRWPWF